jgi:2-polyprenyl-3-methyl-5-hydroxy-6-metoxy-1,4-benzoquinol methylase
VDPEPHDLVDRVRRGYDALSYAYRGDDGDDGGKRRGWMAHLVSRLPARASVLDLGCGNGMPVCGLLVDAGLQVTGVDLSDIQVERARALVPGATFQRADASGVTFEAGSFDAIVCLYMLIHLPLAEQPGLFARMAGWLRPNGILLTVTGHRAWTGSSQSWLGGGAEMWWSQADASAYRDWLEAAGFTVDSEEFVPEGDGGHALFWARRP